MNYVLDACALIACLNNEPGKEIVLDLFRQAVDRKAVLYMSAVNMIEVRYGYIRDLGLERAERIFRQIAISPLTLVRDISDQVLAEAGRLKAAYHCSLADAIACAVAASLNAALVTSDHKELETVEAGEALSFLWLPSRPKK